MVRIDDLLILGQYGTSSRANTQNAGVPVLRMGNLRSDGLDTASIKHVELSAKEVELYALRKGDILFNRTNSKELVGKCAVFDLSGTWVFASYLLRLRVDEGRVLPAFLSRFLASDGGRVQIDRLSRQAIGMANVNLSELRQILMPLPPIETQEALVVETEEAWREFRSATAEAEEIERALGDGLSKELGLELADEPRQFAFAIRASVINGRRMDVAANRPPPSLRGELQIPTVRIGDVASVDVERAQQPVADITDSLVPYVGLPECDLTHVREISRRPYPEVRTASLARVGDILFARIEPSVFNRKYVFVDSLPDGVSGVLTSGEFYVVRAEESRVDPRYLYGLLFTDFFMAQVVGRTTGSSGRRRLQRDLFTSSLLPLPPMNIQKRLAKKFFDARDKAERLSIDAAEAWVSAKQAFDERLTG
jgi:hypothetical protein